jgi:hypothetical protein
MYLLLYLTPDLFPSPFPVREGIKGVRLNRAVGVYVLDAVLVLLLEIMIECKISKDESVTELL